MSSIPQIWRENRQIESFDVDIRGKLRPQIMFSWLLNAAWNHTRGTDYSYDKLSERSLKWVLIKTQINIHRLPMWGEHTTIETWGKKLVKLYALRDFIMISDSGEKLVSATSCWMVIHSDSGRPQRFDMSTASFPWNPEMNELETSLNKVPELLNGCKITQYPVLFSDIDVNRHVHSGSYMRWMIDSHPHQFLTEHDIASIELSFLSEARPGDEIAVFSEKTGDTELCSVRRCGEEKEFCRALFGWKNF
jgi:acyl-ACP thioesterase